MTARPGGALVRGLRRWDFVALVLNSVVGAGIFGLPSRVFALAGVYSLLSYVVCSAATFLIVLCFAEVSSRFEDTGGPYLYARATFGPLVGFEIGWLAWLVRITAFAALCNLFVDYFGYFLPAAGSGIGRGVTIVTIVSSLTAFNLVGVRVAAFVGNLFTVGKLVPLLLLVVVGPFLAEPQRYVSAAVPGYSAFSASVLILMFAFTGFENAVVPAGEGADPRRHLPFALLTGAGIAVLLFMAIQAVCIGVLPGLASSSRPLADVGNRLVGPAGAAGISIGALISVTGTMNVIMLGAPRLLFAMAEQRQLPQIVSSTHRRFGTPHVAILLTAAGVLAVTLTGTFASTATLSTIIRLMTYAVTCAALPVLRRRDKGSGPRFKAPAGEALALGALVVVAWLFSSVSWTEAGQAVVAGMVGLILYATLTGRRQAEPAASMSSRGTL